jgi:hypothetical protein
MEIDQLAVNVESHLNMLDRDIHFLTNKVTETSDCKKKLENEIK